MSLYIFKICACVEKKKINVIHSIRMYVQKNNIYRFRTKKILDQSFPLYCVMARTMKNQRDRSERA